MTQSTTGTTEPAPLPSPKERRRLREAKSLSEEQVAAAMGVTRATVRAWETGRTSPRGRKREAYARLIGTAPAASTPRPSSVKPTPPNTPPKTTVGEHAGVEEPRADEPSPAAEEAPAVVEAPAGAEAAAGAEGPAGKKASTVDKAAVAGGTEVAEGTAAVGEGPEAASPAGDGPVADEAASGEEPGPSPAEAFDALYRHAAPAIFRQVYLLTGRLALSREAVGKAFEVAWDRWPEVAVDRDPVGWVRAAAYEHAMSPWHQLRREHRRPDPPPEAPEPRALLDALLALPPAYRRTLLLHDGVGLGLPETAAETEASTPAAAGRLMTARAAVAEQVPGLDGDGEPDEQSALIRERLGALALTQPASSLPLPELIRNGGERKAELWTRAAVAFTVLIIGLTLITLATAPRRYETPESPPQKVEGVPPLGGPQKLTPQDEKLRKKLGDELVHGPARLVPRAE
ncbi:helix-turn-helix domain-containing protein [Streptomyces sp. NPDC059783]|uniref:helix-turn-helix domain-containing protein n=1 Tax=Streptomyces sp. NPDC059783 TaxID=3346944 RepID=UPI00365118BD